MRTTKIKSVKNIGFHPSVDFEVDHPDHNFYAEGLLSSNSHSLSYAALGALTAYLKFKYPQQFYCSLFNQARNEPKPIEEITKIQSELHYFGIRLLPPHLIKSKMDFAIEGNDIRFGLASVKGLGDKTIEKIQQFQNEYANKFEMFEGAQNAGLSISVLSALIQSGCLSELVELQSRPHLTYEAQLWNLLKPKEKVLCMQFGKVHDFHLFKTVRYLVQSNDDKGKPYIKASRYETIRKHCNPYREIYEQNSQPQNRALANYFYERVLLGYSYSSKLIDIFNNGMLVSVDDIKHSDEDTEVEFVGVVSEKPFEGKSAGKQQKYAKWTISDETGAIDCLIFNFEDKKKNFHDNLENNKARNNGKTPQKDSIVRCRGRKKGDAVFLKEILIQDDKIYTKFRDLDRDRKKEREKNSLAISDKVE